VNKSGVALPREAQETNSFKGLDQGLGKNCPIDLQGVSERLPKPFGRLPFGMTGPINTYNRHRAEGRVSNPFVRDTAGSIDAPMLLARGAAS
jgi:hypothetical protein